MSESIENIEINRFYTSWMQDIIANQQSNQDGSNSEQIFTEGSLDLLAEAGEVENFRTAYDEKALGTAKQHKINAYAISENYETVDLFVSIFKGTDEITKIGGDEIDQASKRICNFFRKAIYSNENEKSKSFKNEYVHEIEESSEIFQFANTLGRDKELRENLVRVNATILTNGLYGGEFPDNTEISGYKIYFKIFDLEALYNVSEKSHIPIEINFKEDGFDVPCISSPSINSEYQSYLAIIPGSALASIYERFGSRLLEQNVRSFLQFSGKINKGIRKTIIDEPHMFLAFNNGIAATADEVSFVQNDQGNGLLLASVRDLQIVNGGQTTASIYHTWKKDKANISNIFVQVKLSLVKNKEKFSDIVSRISEYANTQNKVSVADLSSNRPYHIELEKLSRSIYTPLSDSNSIQTKWFYERARGQYKNARVKDGFTKSRQKAFDLKNPKHQVFTKEELAKYLNAYEEVIEGKKNLIGPHYVVRGNQKNYIQFINFNLVKKPSSIYFEDAIAKAILFKSAEKAYGVKPNSIGDMRYVTVPYTISLLSLLTKSKIDLYKIWKAQKVSNELNLILFDMMKKVEAHIKSTAPGGLYAEWAKKEECWINLKESKLTFDLSTLGNDLISNTSKKRQVLTETEIIELQNEEEVEFIKSIPPFVLKKIEKWGVSNGYLSINQANIVNNIANSLKSNRTFSVIEINTIINIINTIIEKAPEEFEFEDDLINQFVQMKAPKEQVEITIELVTKIVQWDKKNKRLKPHEFTFMMELIDGKKTLTERNIQLVGFNLTKVKKYGFISE
jgi:hypothetical protein